MKLRYQMSELAESSAHRRLGALLPGDAGVWRRLVASLLYAALLAASSLVVAVTAVYAMSALANGVLALLVAWVGGVAVLVSVPFVAVRSAVWLLARSRR